MTRAMMIVSCPQRHYWRLIIVLLTSYLLLTFAPVTSADGKSDDYYNNVGANDDLSAWDGSDDKFYSGADAIKYWTNYALLPKRCIQYGGQDVIVFSVFENRAKQCSDNPMGTYYEPVPTFLAAYMKQKYQDAIDQGNDYEDPDVIQYAYCVGFYINQVMYYLQVGCADGTTSSLAINIYEDNACTIKSTNEDGYDDSNFDVSDIQINFKKCHNCVNWFDMSQDVDDGFYEKRMTQAPLCSTVWASKKTCDRKCQHIGSEKSRSASSGGWNTSDHVLLIILCTFGLTLVGLIIRKRNKMSNKDALLEQAAMSAAGLQQPHLVGLFILIVMVIAVFALLGLKNITWALLLLINTALFAYLMKLTVDSTANAAGETMIGPDGTVIRKDDSEDDSDDEDNVGTYSNNHNFAGSGIGVLSTIASSPTGTATTAPTPLSAAGTTATVDYGENRASATSYVLPTLD